MKRIVLLITSVAALMMGCDKGDDGQGGKGDGTIGQNTYTGTLKVDQNDGTFFTQENVVLELVPAEEGSQIRMMQVSFSDRMPVKVDISIDGITTAETTEGLLLSGEGLVPTAMGGALPAYTVTGLDGKVTLSTMTISMTCGSYPLTFNGSVAAQ